MKKKLTYADAGVDIEKADHLVETIKKIAKKTRRTGVMGEIGGFGGLFSLNTANMKNPVLVSSTDGVGTKLKIAFLMNRHDTVGIDLVGMCVNDIAVQGARPLFFLDYLATGKLKTGTVTDIIKGVGEGCIQADCALIGGETAEMPGFYRENEYDLAGFAVGIVDNSKIVDGSEIRPGHQIIGIASSGLHSNGYSLVRKICFEVLGLKVDSHVPELGKSLGEELITPTRIYSETIQSLVRDLPIQGLAHITGGGIMDNIVRIIPQACGIAIKKGSWDIPPIFPFLQEAGNVDDKEMMRTFNNGIGLVAVVPEEKLQEVINRLTGSGEKAWAIGEVTKTRKNARTRVQLV
ncbi:phosphoribosylformylglycinamidine cyclo-ligase [Desulfosarcina sp.]|uniref:phosphoribosylformylglycinamidine cyclo-ligase n=1 Tax=Desulfosarcina sp. TaxID=2027861 RepID=UPI0029A23918|nr:phosphoribosylformylglycinamidine cyclo-ligase [Desulfosarcina sp.]MDX2453378.1 phosphoribosylformylglycinamidine cyclo-ligase [Desulfosarcina sp.]MDX2491099.1 phosphoribosylformylglycinamidine cyclo-ligase [Desulfosarcina sp.]